MNLGLDGCVCTSQKVQPNKYHCHYPKKKKTSIIVFGKDKKNVKEIAKSSFGKHHKNTKREIENENDIALSSMHG